METVEVTFLKRAKAFEKKHKVSRDSAFLAVFLVSVLENQERTSKSMESFFVGFERLSRSIGR